MTYFPMIPYRGGVQRVTTILSHELVRRGHNVCFLCYDASRDNQMLEREIEFPQYYLDISSNNRGKIGVLIHNFLVEHKIDYLISQEQDKGSELLLEVIDNSVSVISVHHVVPLAGRYATRKSIIRMPSDTLRMIIIKTIALISPRFFSWYRIKKERNVFNKVIRYSDKFVFISERHLKRVLECMPNVPSSKLAAINNPNTFDTNNPVFFETKKNIILWVGRVDANKNCMDFIKAWKMFSKTNSDWEAMVAGEGPLLSECKQWADSHKVDRITFWGNYKDMIDLYRVAKIFVSTSYSESWGMSLTEAMSMGCVPCVYNTYETLADIIKDGVDGILCEPKPSQLAYALAKIACDEIGMASMAAAARISVSRFSASNICDQWEKLLFTNKTK